ncbi:MAG: protein phosphatase 2C domain-containing protein [Acidimicrobiales bacterium]
MCPVCGATIEAGDAFCEVCGSPLAVKGMEKGAVPTTTAPPSGDGEGRSQDPGATAGATTAAAGSSPEDELSPTELPSSSGRTAAGASGSAPTGAGDRSPTDASVPTVPAWPLGHREPCAHCGAGPDNIDRDGYCGICGRRQPGPRDHHELDFGWAAGVTDKGHRHPTNQDAFHLELAGPAGDHGVVAVVCDGVSSSVHAEEAAEAAATAAGTVLAAVVAGPGTLEEATVHAALAANKAVTALPWTAVGSLASPSCTFVSAVCRGGEITVGSVGDSRVYWLGPPDGVRQLTVDDSWAEAQVEAGRMTEAEAEADLRSHAITRWVGADAPEADPRIVTLTPALPGRLLLCSDGLWNYAPTAADLAEVLARQPDPSTPLELARSLTTFALDAGGHDNITVVVIDVPGSAPAEPEKGSTEKGSP